MGPKSTASIIEMCSSWRSICCQLSAQDRTQSSWSLVLTCGQPTALRWPSSRGDYHIWWRPMRQCVCQVSIQDRNEQRQRLVHLRCGLNVSTTRCTVHRTINSILDAKKSPFLIYPTYLQCISRIRILKFSLYNGLMKLKGAVKCWQDKAALLMTKLQSHCLPHTAYCWYHSVALL